MRLAKVSHGHTFKKRMLLRFIRLVSRKEPPDVVKTLLYRPEFYGKPFSHLLQIALRGPSYWTVGERELFAAMTAKIEACHF
ncbi:MAG: hypothetical protein K8W52_36520 [Deltaproteobacteria bacterium]|nr:hypothetical protein [Deltaproteobacteria bacterium]